MGNKRIYFNILLLSLFFVILSNLTFSYEENNPSVLTKTQSSAKPTESETICGTNESFSKFDRNLLPRFIFNEYPNDYYGFYVKLKENDQNCTYEKLLEGMGVRVIHSLTHNRIYLVFTKEDVNSKIAEVANQDFVDSVDPSILSAQKLGDEEKFSVIINLNQVDNITTNQVSEGGKLINKYVGPGHLGRTLEQNGVKLSSYHPILNSYYATASPSSLKNISALSFVVFIELQLDGGAGSILENEISGHNNASLLSRNLSANSSLPILFNETKFESNFSQNNESISAPISENKNWIQKAIFAINSFFKKIFKNETE